MCTRETYLQDVVAQLLKLNFEITLMKFKVEQAMPEVMRECYCHVKSLRDQYRSVETQIQVLEEEQGETWEDLCPEIDRGLRELSDAFESVGNLVRMRLAEDFCLPIDLPGSYHNNWTVKGPGRAPRVSLKARRRSKKRAPKFAGIFE
jgi:hypothetical protein